jgi:ATP-dependent Lhr-like helicase
MYGLARPAEGWERDYLPSRVEQYDPNALGRLAASGSLVWAAEPRADSASTSVARVARVRFFERGSGRLWLAAAGDESALSDHARKVLGVLRDQGASFIGDLMVASGLGPQATREALRDLVAAGLVTNDTVDALRDVLRWRGVLPIKRGNEPDPTRWLPADFKPSGNRPVVQRRVNLRRLPKWRRPEHEEGATGSWGGRWSLVHTPGTLGPARDEQELAELVARKWLERYGIVSRDWWRRERPAVGWREIYHELKRLEFRGEVQRGYFVAGLAGAQFALPEAVEMLRSSDEEAVVAMPTTDPANVYSLPLAIGVEADALAHPRGSGATLVTVGGKIILAAESKGARIRVRSGASSDEVREAAAALGQRLVRRNGPARRRDVVVETIDGERAAGSRWADAFLEAGYRGMGTGLRYFAGV